VTEIFDLYVEESERQVKVDSFATIEEALKARNQLRKWCKAFAEVTRVYVSATDDMGNVQHWGFSREANSTNKNIW
jgi:hypothetical protein